MHIKFQDMKKALVLLVSLLISITSTEVFAQQEFRSSRDSQWLIQLRPEMTLSAYWFFWSNGVASITMNAQLENPTSWVSDITLENATSSSCSEIGTMKMDLVAPSMPGLYTARILDLNSNYDPINITLLVSDVLIPLDSINLTGFVNQEILVPEPRINDGKSNLGCLDPFYPSDSESYEFFWIADGIPGSISTTPSEFTLMNDEQIVLQNSASFSQAGSYSAFRVGKVEFSDALGVLKVNFSIAENPTGIDLPVGNITIMAFPNPASDFVTIPSNSDILIYSVDGKLIRKVNSVNNQSQMQINISDLKSGIYIAQSGLNNYRIVKQ